MRWECADIGGGRRAALWGAWARCARSAARLAFVKSASSRRKGPALTVNPRQGERRGSREWTALQRRGRSVYAPLGRASVPLLTRLLVKRAVVRRQGRKSHLSITYAFAALEQNSATASVTGNRAESNHESTPAIQRSSRLAGR